MRKIEHVLKRVRNGPRMLIVWTDASEVVDSLVHWAGLGHARYQLALTERGTEIRVYLLPQDFDEHPFLAWRPPIAAMDAAHAH